MDLHVLHVLRSPDFKNHIFRGWSVCMRVCAYVCICVSEININKKKNYSRIFKFGILHLYYMKMLLERSDKNSVYRGAQNISNTYDLRTEFLLIEF